MTGFPMTECSIRQRLGSILSAGGGRLVALPKQPLSVHRKTHLMKSFRLDPDSVTEFLRSWPVFLAGGKGAIHLIRPVEVA